MSERLPFTQARIVRAIKAAEKAGKRVTGIRPDGTILVQDGDAPIAPTETQEHDAASNSWADR